VAINTVKRLTKINPNISPVAKGLSFSKRLVMRITFYPPGQGEAHFAKPHEDINLVTVLPKATCSGLAVFSKDGRWVEVEQEASHCVVLIGDMLEQITQGELQATTHKVLSSPSARMSISFFCNPNDETPLSLRWNAGDFLSNRLKEVGLSE
jgi:isopenicillin N synthase-like dioxygenase